MAQWNSQQFHLEAAWNYEHERDCGVRTHEKPCGLGVAVCAAAYGILFCRKPQQTNCSAQAAKRIGFHECVRESRSYSFLYAARK